MRRYHARQLSAIAAAALVALLVSACAADDPADPDPAGAGSATTGPPDPSAGTGESAGEPDGVPDSLDFTGTTLAGEPFDAAELAGEPAVLWFWAGWCPRCRAAAPDVLAAAEHVTVIGVGGLVVTDDSELTGFVEETGTGALTHLSDAEGAVWRKFGVASQDTYVLIDADGTVVHTGGLSGAELRDRAAELAG